MIHKTIQYWETFPTTNGGWVKMVDEILLEPGESPRDAFYEGMRTVQSTFYEMKGLAAKQAAEKKEVENNIPFDEAMLIADIYSCTVVDDGKGGGLKSYKIIAQRTEALKKAFDSQFYKLSAK